MATTKRKRPRRADETALSRSIQSALTARGAWVIRVGTGVIPALYGQTKRFIHLAEPGCPDLLVMRPDTVAAHGARFFWLEVKTKTGRLSDVQKKWHAKAGSRGVSVFTARSISDAMGALDSMGGNR